jgi:DNA-binding MarR family transcriptional regulator
VSSKKSVPYETTWHVRDHCLCLATQRAARALSRKFDDAFRPLGITSGQFSLLMSLNRGGPPPMSAVASLMAMDRTTLTANLKPLVKRGFVAVLVDPKDNRGRLLKLLPKGMAVLTRAVPIWESTHREVERPLSGANRLRSSLQALL